MNWKVFYACATGKHHIDQNIPCQDYSCYEVRDGIFVGVVCDGAGTARESQVGAEFFARQVTALLSEAIASGDLLGDAPAGYRDCIESVLERVRSRLGDLAASQQHDLRDYACTLVGCIASRAGGCFFHVGDGFAVHQNMAGGAVLSHPENGEYVNETYFATDEDWKEHLRLTLLSNMNHGCFIGLMSDGSSSFAIDRLRTGFYKPFIDPVVTFLNTASEINGNQALQNLLENEKTFEITSDDKTLLLAFIS